MKVNLCMITMNAGEDIPGSTIKFCLNNYSSYFNKTFVVDGNLTEEAKKFYNSDRFANVNIEAIDSPWQDSYVDQYRAWRDKIPDGEWVLYLDCDELPSDKLLSFIFGEKKYKEKTFEQLAENFNTLCLPCILCLTEDGIDYYASEDSPKQDYEGQWMKNILVKKDLALDFRYAGSHVIPTHNQAEKGCYIPFPYFHMKSLESFVKNDCWQAFLLPEGQQYNSIDSKMFRLFTKQYKTTKEFKKATKDGTWPVTLKKFAWDRRHEIHNPVSRLAWTYYILEKHPMPEKDELMNWNYVKQFVLDKEQIRLMNDNKEKNNKIKVEI